MLLEKRAERRRRRGRETKETRGGDGKKEVGKREEGTNGYQSNSKE